MVHNFKIKDKFGKEYGLELLQSGDFLENYFIYDGELRIGYAYCYVCGGIAMLHDIKIRDDVFCSQNKFQVFVAKILKKQQAQLSYRNLGIGTALLRFLISHFSARQIKRIEGKIVQRDLDERPFLPHWYQKHGFIVPVTGVGEILKDLS